MKLCLCDVLKISFFLSCFLSEKKERRAANPCSLHEFLYRMSVVRTFPFAIALVLAVQCEARSTGEIPGRRPDQTANKYKSRTVVDLTHLMNGNVPKWPLQTIEPPVTDDDYYNLTLLKEGYWGPASDKWCVILF